MTERTSGRALPRPPRCGTYLRQERGQAMIMVALAMVAMLSMIAVVLMGGQLYLERRLLQEIADSGALAGAPLIPCSSSNAYAAVDGLLSRQMGVSPSLPQTPGDCGAGPASWSRTYPDGTAVVASYPYSKPNQIQVLVSRPVPLILGALLSAPAPSVKARAVAQNAGASPPLNYALYAQNGLSCSGSSVISVRGSVYVGGSIATECSLYAHEIPDSDPGNILVKVPGQQWSGGGSCSGGLPSGKAICADGYEVSQDVCPTPRSTDFLGTSTVDYPCPSWSVPASDFSRYVSPDPNADLNVLATIGGVPCSSSAGAVTYLPLLVKGTLVGRLRPGVYTINGTSSPNTPYRDADGYYHMRPGCYGWLDLSLVLAADSTAKPAVVFDPGFYYFSGYFQSSDAHGKSGPQTAGGLCLNGTQALGRDVLFEVTSSVGPSSLSSSTCDEVPTSSNNAAFGVDPATPITDLGTAYGYLSAPCDPALNPQCPLTGGSSWCPGTDRACNATLVWAPAGPPASTEPAIDGSYFDKGPTEESWLYGTVFWPGGPSSGEAGCSWAANASATIVGALICKSVSLQGGSSSAGVGITYARTDSNSAPTEAGLVE